MKSLIERNSFLLISLQIQGNAFTTIFWSMLKLIKDCFFHCIVAILSKYCEKWQPRAIHGRDYLQCICSIYIFKVWYSYIHHHWSSQKTDFALLQSCHRVIINHQVDPSDNLSFMFKISEISGSSFMTKSWLIWRMIFFKILHLNFV